MPNEINRQLDEQGNIVIIYDDGGRKTLKQSVPQKPSDRDYDADADEAQNSGHVFTPEELAQ